MYLLLIIGRTTTSGSLNTTSPSIPEEMWAMGNQPEANGQVNLGLMAVLLTTETWLPPKDPKLQVASIVSCKATTIFLQPTWSPLVCLHTNLGILRSLHVLLDFHPTLFVTLGVSKLGLSSMFGHQRLGMKAFPLQLHLEHNRLY